MKKEVWLVKLSDMEKEGGWGVQKLFEKDNSGSCPCFSGKFRVDDKVCEVRGRCWRVSDNAQDLHFFGPKEIGIAIKKCLDAQEWYNPYTIIWHSKPFL